MNLHTCTIFLLLFRVLRCVLLFLFRAHARPSGFFKVALSAIDAEFPDVEKDG